MARLARIIHQQGFSAGPGVPCPYLGGREARQLTLRLDAPAPGLYHALMDLNFRRLGGVFYRPQCDACQECRMIRVVAQEFRPSRAQRRCLGRNADVRLSVARPQPTPEKLELYRRYLAARHDGAMDGSEQEFESFLYASELHTIECEYRVDGRLIGVGIADHEPDALSAVYCYFDPAESRRAPGVLNVLSLLDACRRRGIRHLYLGYYVRDCGKMSYKAEYRPCEVLGGDGRWRRMERAPTFTTDVPASS